MLIAIYFVGFVADAASQTSRTDELAEIKSKIDQLEKKLASQNQKEAETLDLIDTIDRKVNVAKEYVSKLRREINRQERKIETLQARQDTLLRNLENIKAGFSNRLVSLYKYGRVSTLELLVDAKSLQQIEVWAEYQRRLAENDQRKISSIQQEQQRLLQTQRQLGREIQKEQALLEEKSREEKELASDRQARKKLLDKIRQDKNSYQKQLDDHQKAIREIRRLIAESENTASTSPSGAADFVAGTPFTSLKGRLPWPASGRVHRDYGP